MNKLTRNALEKSIQHWERMMDNKRKKSMHKKSTDGLEMPWDTDCALCRRFKLKSNSCEGCPIMLKTGCYECHNTPYYDARAAFDCYGIDSRAFKKEAQNMIDFLISLRDQP